MVRLDLLVNQRNPFPRGLLVIDNDVLDASDWIERNSLRKYEEKASRLSAGMNPT